MRTRLIPSENIDEARKEMPWAYIVSEVLGGFIGFETTADYYLWRDRYTVNEWITKLMSFKNLREAEEAMPWAFEMLDASMENLCAQEFRD